MSTRLTPDRRLCVAPMMAWTDRHCRYLHRLAAPHALLFTEMVTASALLHGPTERLLRFNPEEHPVAIQLGGSDPEALARATRLATDAGFDEINLNVGCPSPRVRKGRFGACLMLEPQLVADCVRAMIAAAGPVPVTVKCRLGVDDADSDALLEAFIAQVREAACTTFYVHARKALLNGLSPAQNRTVPPLQHDRAYRLRPLFPDCEFILNGGVDDVAALDTHLAALDGVMIGRAAYQNPQLLGEMDAHLFGGRPLDPWSLMQGYGVYMEQQLAAGARLHDLTRHVLGLFAGVPGARRFRQLLSDAGRLKADDVGLVHEALAAVARRAA